MGMDATETRDTLCRANELAKGIARLERSVVTARANYDDKPKDDRLRHKWAEKSRLLSGMKQELAELRERLKDSWQ